jgi:PAS domain S-box-containing protein
MRLRTKLLMLYLGLLFTLFSFGGLGALFLTEDTVTERVEKELRDGTTAIINLVETTAQGSIVNYLRAVAERNLEIAHALYQRHLDGELSEKEAREQIRSTLLSQTIGKTGYIYCIDSQGIATVHPNAGVEGNNWIHHDFVYRQTQLKTGYIEYQWKNPGEPALRPKALYMSYFEPFDWIISASTYREEFRHLLPMEEIRRSIRDLTYGTSGYIFVASEEGDLIVHPELEGRNFYQLPVKDRRFFEEMVTRKKGFTFYWWQNPGEDRPRKKMASYGNIAELGWIVGTTGYVEEIYAPVRRARDIIILFATCAMLLGTLLTIVVSNSITERLRHLMAIIARGDEGDLTVRVAPGPDDEIGRLGSLYNAFLKRLQSYHNRLKEEAEEHRLTALSLQESEATLAAVFNQTFQLMGILAPDGTIRRINRTALDFAGIEEGSVLAGKKVWEAPYWRHSEEQRQAVKKAVRQASEGKFSRMEVTHYRHDGELRHMDFSLSPIRDATGDISMIISESRDITEQKQMEKRLLHSQKLDAIGILAGGVAHDFNNHLQAISGYTQLLQLHGHGSDKEKEMLETIQHSTRHASELTRQLLTFSREIESRLVPVDLNDEVKTVVRLLRRTLPRMTRIETEAAGGLHKVKADRAQLEQVIMNLSINASHAMPDGGILTIATGNTELDDAFCSGHADAEPGPYVMLSITDTGHGMDAATREHIFEPFFTTRETGAGTGLGLAMVYGIVQNHKGMITCYSEPGRGTVFRIYFPTVADASDTENRPQPRTAIQGGHEHIMVVDDEQTLRDLGRDLLERFGYRVCQAENGETALERFQEMRADLDMILLDLNMPGMGGVRCLEELKTIDPGMPVLIASGFAPDGEARATIDRLAQGFVDKPYEITGLLQAVRRALDARHQEREYST